MQSSLSESCYEVTCALVLVDLGVAFDTVYHQILLRVLSRRFGVGNEGRIKPPVKTPLGQKLPIYQR